MGVKDEIKGKEMGSCYLGIDVGGTNLKVAVINDYNNIIDKHIELVSKANAEETRKQIMSVIELSLKRNEEIKAIGLGLPGIVDASKGIMIQSPNLSHFANIDIRDDISTYFKIPVFVDNDVNLSALAEFKMNPVIIKNGFKNIILLAIGTGVGGGIILNGEIWKGTSGFAGELGHICIDINGEICNCGGKGCLETYASSTGIIKRAKKHLWRFPNSSLSRIPVEKINTEDIFEAAKNNDAAGVYLVQSFTEALAAGIGSLINVFNPQAIILGGGVFVPNSYLIDKIREQAQRFSFKKPYLECMILPSYLKNDSGVVGAAFLAKEEFEKLQK